MSWLTRRQARQGLERMENNMARISSAMNSVDVAQRIGATFEAAGVLKVARDIIKDLGVNRENPTNREFWNDPKFVRSFGSFVNTAKEFEAQVMQNQLLFPSKTKQKRGSKQNA